jgi:hypothetical protein
MATCLGRQAPDVPGTTRISPRPCGDLIIGGETRSGASVESDQYYVGWLVAPDALSGLSCGAYRLSMNRLVRVIASSPTGVNVPVATIAT